MIRMVLSSFHYTCTCIKVIQCYILAGVLFASEMLQNLLLSKLLIFKKYPLISLISNSLLKIMN